MGSEDACCFRDHGTKHELSRAHAPSPPYFGILRPVTHPKESPEAETVHGSSAPTRPFDYYTWPAS
jgi:hypothetical protein